MVAKADKKGVGHNEDWSSIDNAVAYRIQRVARRLRVHLLQFFKEHEVDVSPEQFFMLFRLHERDGRSQKELADATLNDHPNVTRMVDGLVAKGLVVRNKDPEDRRRSKIVLTAAGKKLMKGLRPLVFETRKDIYRGISQKERNQLVALLEKIEANISV